MRTVIPGAEKIKQGEYSMQAVILAAGKGTRMGGLTATMPKPLLEVAGKTLLEHKLDILPDDIDEIVIVVGYRADEIKKRYGSSSRNKKITYVTQKNYAGGTADALWQCRAHLTGKFLVLMGDDIYSREDIDACRAYDWAILVQRVPDTSAGGKVIMNARHQVVDILEINDGGEGIVNTNMFALDTRLFDFQLIPKAPGSGELGLPQTVLAASKVSGIPLHVVEAVRWIQITNPEDLERAEERIRVE